VNMTMTREPVAAPTAPPGGARLRVAAVLAGWIVLVVAVAVTGDVLLDRGVELWTRLPPLTGRFDPRASVLVVPALTASLAVVWWGPRLARTMGWRELLWLSFAAATVWGAALAFADGADGFLASPSAADDYLASLGAVGDPVGFLGHFIADLPTYVTHVRAHPPGLLLALFGMDRAGLGGPGWFAVLQMLAAAAPFVVLVPAAVFWSSGDAVLLGVSAWAAALLVLATGTTATGRRGTLLALAGGTLFGVSLFLSYGLALLALVPLAVAWRRRVRPLVVSAAPVAVIVALFGAAGVWWWDGLAAAVHEHDVFVTNTRPYWYFLLANVAALSLVLGPAVVALLARPRERQVWPLVAGALLALVVADVSGLSEGEVERIWLPFVPWIVVAAAAYAGDPTRRIRAWLTAQAAMAIGLQTMVSTHW